MQLSPYLFFNGNCEEAFNAYARILGGKIQTMMKHRGSPAEEHAQKEWLDKILHASLEFDGQLLMASDAPPEHFETPKGFFVSVSMEDTKKGERVFNELAEGGKVIMPFAETFWAKKFGMLVDRFGTPWMINCARPEAKQ